MTRRLILLIADADTGEVMAGKEVVGQIGPVTPSTSRLVKAMDAYINTLGTPATRYEAIYEVLVSEPVDLSGAEVKVPDFSEFSKGWAFGEGVKWGIEQITAQMKGE